MNPKACMLLGVLTLAAADGHAAEQTRTDQQGASGMCQGALAAYNANLRARPLGLANEGTATAFVSCAWQGDDTANGRGSQQIQVVIGNNGTAAATVSCTLVNGFQAGTFVNATYTTKSATIAAGAAATISWVPGDITGAPPEIRLPALSCQLPPATVIQHTVKSYLEEVGA